MRIGVAGLAWERTPTPICESAWSASARSVMRDLVLSKGLADALRGGCFARGYCTPCVVGGSLPLVIGGLGGRAGRQHGLAGNRLRRFAHA